MAKRKTYTGIESILIKNPAVKWWEPWLLGKIEFAGHWNKVSGPRRALSALWQTLIALAVLAILSVFAHNFNRINLSPLDNDAWLGSLALISGIFGATFINERSALHNKWQYLANTYTQAICIDNRRIQDHALAFLAHDILIMEMWAHVSFQRAFKDVLQEAVEKCGTHFNCAPDELDEIANNGIEYERAMKLIDALTDHYDDVCEKASRVS